MTSWIEREVFVVALPCGFATSTHFAHKAEFCGDYPDLPDWLTHGSVWQA